MSASALNLPLPPRRPSSRGGSGAALLGAFASTLGLLRALLGGLVAIYLTSGITLVSAHEDALVYRFGKLQREVHPPGILLALPAPFDRVVKVSTRTQHELVLVGWSPEESDPVLTSGATMSAGKAVAPAKGLHPVFEGYTLTGDTNIVQARFGVRYRIVDPLAYVSAAKPETVDALIDAAIFEAATHTLAAMRIDDALGAGLESFRDHVRGRAQVQVEALKLGVEIVAFEVAALTPPAATVPAFASVTSAQVESRTLVEQARTYQAQTLPQAQAEANRIRQKAMTAQPELVSRATAEASSFGALAAQHAHAPALVEARLRAETLDLVLARVKSGTVLPADESRYHFFLPNK